MSAERHADVDWLKDTEPRPLQGWQITVTRSVLWQDAAINDVRYFQTSASALGIPSDAIDAGTRIIEGHYRVAAGIEEQLGSGPPYFDTPEHRAEYFADQLVEARHGAAGKLLDWLSRREYQTLAETSIDVLVPVFLLSAPPVKGCIVTLEQTHATTINSGLDLKVFGTGLSASREACVKVGSKEEIAAGDAEVIFVNVPVTVRKVQVLEAGKPIGVGFQQDVDEVKLARRTASVAHAPKEALVAATDTFMESSQETADTSSFLTPTLDYTTTAAHGVSIGFKAFGDDQTLKCTVETDYGIALECKLRGGHYYLAKHYLGGPGIVWTLPTSP